MVKKYVCFLCMVMMMPLYAGKGDGEVVVVRNPLMELVAAQRVQRSNSAMALPLRRSGTLFESEQDQRASSSAEALGRSAGTLMRHRGTFFDVGAIRAESFPQNYGQLTKEDLEKVVEEGFFCAQAIIFREVDARSKENVENVFTYLVLYSGISLKIKAKEEELVVLQNKAQEHLNAFYVSCDLMHRDEMGKALDAFVRAKGVLAVLLETKAQQQAKILKTFADEGIDLDSDALSRFEEDYRDYKEKK